MYLYQLSDSAAWFDVHLYSDIEEARQSALDYMDRPAWETTSHMLILRINTDSLTVDDIEIVIHGEYRAEVYKVED